MQSIKSLIYIVIFSLVFASCSNKGYDSFDKNIEEIILLTIDKNSFPLPPPPKFVGDSIVNDSKNIKLVDSLKKVSLNIAIYPIIKTLKINVKDLLLDDNENLTQNFSNVELSKKIDINFIDNQSQHNIVYADSSILKKSRDWKEYDLLFSFSKFTFSNDKKNAKSYIGISRSALWGQAFEFSYKKDEKGVWEITKKVPKEIW